MKKVEAVIQPHKLEEVKEALRGIGIDGVTLSEVLGHGRQKGHTEIYRGQEYKVDYRPKMKLEIVVAELRLSQVVETIMESARSGRIGDGKIFVTTVDDVIRIRNGDHGENAL